MYLVTGATGNVGSEVVRALHAGGEDVAALVRQTPLAGAWLAGVETRSGDLSDATTLRDAWDGIQALFLLPGYDATPTILRDARAAGVQRVVLLSGFSAGSGDLSNAITAYMARSESAVRDAGLSWTILRPVAFMSNALRWRDKLRAGDVLRLPFASVRTASIDPFDLAAVAVAALRDDRHNGQVLSPTGPASLLPSDQVSTLAEVLGRDLRFEAQPNDEARSEMLKTTPPAYVDAFFDFYVAGSLDESQVNDTVVEITGRPPRTFEEWARRHATDFV
ncbi:MAG: NAD(P)H-binding protein [Acidimicrobiaceae bacterium]|nr:NAD(P)H-binding protein [Acidimicrobiaceae bacterium]